MSKELNSEISLILEQITTRLKTYIKSFDSRQTTLLEKLKSIDNYIKKKLSTKFLFLNNFDEKENTFSLLKDNLLDNNVKYSLNNTLKKSFENEKFLTSYQYIIIKLKRKLKQQHEKFQLQELAYLERISTLQKKLEIYKENKNNEINISRNNNKNFENINKLTKNIVLNPNKNKISFNFNKIKENQINNSNNQINIFNKNDNNKIFSKTFYNLKYNKKTINEVDISKMDLNFEDSKNQNKENIVEQKLFLNKYLVSMKNSKIRSRTINTAIKHNFIDIKKEIEDSKKKIRIIQNTNIPQIYRKENLFIET